MFQSDSLLTFCMHNQAGVNTVDPDRLTGILREKCIDGWSFILITNIGRYGDSIVGFNGFHISPTPV